jgi:hypothetical protein
MCNLAAGCASSTNLPYTHYKKATATSTVGTFYTYTSTITNWEALDVVAVLDSANKQIFYECSNVYTSGCSVVGPLDKGNRGIWNRRFDLINTGTTPVQPKTKSAPTAVSCMSIDQYGIIKRYSKATASAGLFDIANIAEYTIKTGEYLCDKKNVLKCDDAAKCAASYPRAEADGWSL